jgi:hypothetical protein
MHASRQATTRGSTLMESLSTARRPARWLNRSLRLFADVLALDLLGFSGVNVLLILVWLVLAWKLLGQYKTVAGDLSQK